MNWLDPLLKLDIANPPVTTIAWVLSLGAVIFLLARRPSPRWLITATVGISAGLLMSALTWFLTVRVFNLFGVGLGTVTYVWFGAACAASGLALVNLWKTKPLRRSLAAASVLLFAATGALGINASFGLDRTLGALLGINTLPQIALTPPETPSAGGLRPNPAARPLWQTWTPPADLPATGSTGSQVIPNTLSGFTSRPAGIYLPPAALVPNAPALPLVILLMGQPGNPDPEYVATSLDKEAARHGGLAPIVVVADQLGDPTIDPLCLDSAKFGNAETFLTRDVVNWASANLNVIQDHRYWTIAGYSNGGQCAISLAAKHPDIWSNVLDISGEAFPGSEITAQSLSDVFNGNQAAYDAEKPVTLLSAHRLPGDFAIFTVGSLDPGIAAGQRTVAAAAENAGITTIYHEIPNADHLVSALAGGLDFGFDALFPRLGLAAPPHA
ncbi:esterase [Cryobacterium breve]|uniref:Esterase n=1 Tax=Cryobacterium breve TaxID=1259258 RepID=A0ABY7NAI2_9MICO|nr:alpha/beta hydrolase-fold protein [Cryobacterium breve]WBM79002.1 esterase [Cryobacterium breve]